MNIDNQSAMLEAYWSGYFNQPLPDNLEQNETIVQVWNEGKQDAINNEE